MPFTAKIKLTAATFAVALCAILWSTKPSPSHTTSGEVVNDTQENQGGMISGNQEKKGTSPQKQNVRQIAVTMSHFGGKDVFTDNSKSIADKFALLAARASGNDQESLHFAAELANECAAVSQLPTGHPPLGYSHATDYQLKTQRLVNRECAGVLNSPVFGQIKSWLRNNPVDARTDSALKKMQQTSHERGAYAAIQSAIGLLQERPDESTAMAVAENLSRLDLSNIYSEPQFGLTASTSTQQRSMTLRYAFSLLACDFGRPCGPNSFAVRSTCLALGACVPGADLATVYEKELLTGQQVRDVATTLTFLRQVPGTAVGDSL